MKTLARRAGLLALAACGAISLGTSGTQTAIANGDTRTLTLFHAHTQENLTITFRKDGSYDKSALDKLNWFLRDWRRDEPTNMDPRLFDIVWATQRDAGSTATVRVVSAYRSPETNSMLRRRSSAVAKQSQHMLGKAMDLHVPDVSMAKVREMGMRLQYGGVGYYPTAGTPFVHLDVGSVRSWPRMPRQQLERLFPDGKTVHIPADGTPLSGYESALASIQERGGSALAYSDITNPRKGFWATLFGSEEDDTEVITTRKGGRAVATRGNTQNRPAQQVAVASMGGSDSSSVYSIGGPALTTAAITQPSRSEPVKPVPVRAKVVEETPEAEAPKPEVKTVAVAALAPSPALRAGNEETDAKPGPRTVSLPLPPRRPADLITTASINVPAPPIRPVQLALAETSAPAATPEAAKAESLPLPPVAVNVPAPVPRPVQVAVATPAPAAVDRSALPAAILGSLRGDVPAQAAPAQTLAFAAPGVPAPPARPVSALPAAAPVASLKAEPPRQSVPGKDAPTDKYALKMDAAAMNSLMAGVSADKDKPQRTEKVAMPSVQQTVGSVLVAGRFGAASSIAGSGRFTGAMVRPIQAGFIRKGE